MRIQEPDSTVSLDCIRSALNVLTTLFVEQVIACEHAPIIEQDRAWIADVPQRAALHDGVHRFAFPGRKGWSNVARVVRGERKDVLLAPALRVCRDRDAYPHRSGPIAVRGKHRTVLERNAIHRVAPDAGRPRPAP